MQYFNISSGISLTHVQVEQAARDDVEQMEKEVNDGDAKENDKESKSKEDLPEGDEAQAGISFVSG